MNNPVPFPTLNYFSKCDIIFLELTKVSSNIIFPLHFVTLFIPDQRFNNSPTLWKQFSKIGEVILFLNNTVTCKCKLVTCYCKVLTNQNCIIFSKNKSSVLP